MKIPDNRFGFTLIELLVVVLIVAILAAIALPQYEAAVNKSRAAQALSTLKSFGEAQKRYFLVNGKYASSFQDFDISMSDTCTGSSCKVGNYLYYLWTNPQRQIAVYWGGENLDVPSATIAMSYFYDDPPSESAYYAEGVTQGQYMCDPRARKMSEKTCLSLAGEDYRTAGGHYLWH